MFTKDKKYRISADIPIQNIKEMPVAILTSDKDNVCPAAQAKWIFKRIKTLDKKYFVVRSMAHEKFVTTPDEAYFNDIRRALLVGTEFGNEALNIEDDHIFELFQN